MALKFDPVALFIATFILSGCAACVSSVYGASMALVLGLGAIIIFHSPWRLLWPRFVAVNIFILITWIIVPCTTSGHVLLKWGFLAWTSEGINLCILITLKANAILLIFTAMLGEMRPIQVGQALFFLHCPVALGWLFILLERNVALLSGQWHKLDTAAKLRGFAPQANLRTYKTYGAMLAMFIAGAYEQADKLNTALKLRGGLETLPFRHTLNDPRADIVLLCAAVLGAILPLALDIYVS